MPESSGVPIVLTPYDLAEQAVQLGSKRYFTRTGVVTFYDDFSGGLGSWVPSSVNITWTAARSLGNGFSCSMAVGATDLSIYRDDAGALGEGLVGIESSFYMGTSLLQFFINWEYNIHNVTWGAYLVINPTAITITSGTGGSTLNLTPVPDLSLSWHHVKLIVDFNDKNYYYMYLDDSEYYLSSYVLARSITTVTAERSRLTIGTGNIPPSVAGGNNYIGNAIVTKDES